MHAAATEEHPVRFVVALPKEKADAKKRKSEL
jgi:hypothetical protein